LGDGLETLNGFTWKHGSFADTKGILFWPDVFLHDTKDENIAIILMDTQGLFETGSTQDENSRIFGLSTLISSIQIVNLKDVIREDQIEYLEMATSLAKFIAKEQFEHKKLWKPFQKLLFLIRDWTDEDFEFGYGGGEKYLKTFLDVRGPEQSTSTKVRENIRDSFDLISCYLLNEPGSEIKKKDFKGEWSKLAENFVKNLKLLIESILKPENLLKKSVLGHNLTCFEYRDFIFNCLTAFQNTEVPEMKNIYKLSVENHLKRVSKQYLQDYQLKIRESIIFNDNFEREFDEKHIKLKNETILKFLSAEKYNDAEVLPTYEDKLKNDIEETFKSIRELTLKEYLLIKNHKTSLNKDKEINELKSKMNLNSKQYFEDIQKLKNEMERNSEKFKNQINQNELLATDDVEKMKQNELIMQKYQIMRQDYENKLFWYKTIATIAAVGAFAAFSIILRPVSWADIKVLFQSIEPHCTKQNMEYVRKVYDAWLESQIRMEGLEKRHQKASIYIPSLEMPSFNNLASSSCKIPEYGNY
jgi:atlastin